MKTTFNTLAEFEQILRDKLNMRDYHIIHEDDQPKFMEVETSPHKIRRVKAKPGNKWGQLEFVFSITENGKQKKIRFQVPRVVFLLETPTCNISGLVIDQINNIPSDNRIENLRAIGSKIFKQRQN
jgi:hypothetical protein